MMKHIPVILLVLLVLLSGCITIGEQPSELKCIDPEKAINGTCCFDDDDNGVCDINERTCPASCDDSNACTKDYCSLQTSFECKNDQIIPCCGNRQCEPSEDLANACPQDCVVINITNFLHSYTGPDYMENDTYVFIHTGSNETDKKTDFYLNVTASSRKLINIRSTYNCTDSATGHKIDSIGVDRIEVVEGYPEFGHENKLDGADYTIYSSFYTRNIISSIEVSELEQGKTIEYRIRIFKKNYKLRSKLTCDFDFYILEPLKHIKKTLKISYI